MTISLGTGGAAVEPCRTLKLYQICASNKRNARPRSGNRFEVVGGAVVPDWQSVPDKFPQAFGLPLATLAHRA